VPGITVATLTVAMRAPLAISAVVTQATNISALCSETVFAPERVHGDWIAIELRLNSDRIWI
jgi:hypothetical protein